LKQISIEHSAKVAKRGLIVERSKPVFWSWAAQTALADAEVDYKDKEDYSIFVAFELSKESREELNINKKVSMVIWTTTPWTLPSNSGIALHKSENYLITTDGYIIAESRYEALLKEGVIKGEIEESIPSTKFEGKKALNPLNGRDSLIVLGDHVELSGGTGAVHTAPGHGEDDYFLALKYNLEIIMAVDDKGCFDETVEELKLLPNPQEFIGLHIFKANEKILELLGDKLLKKDKFIHSYPFCWRTKKPVIYRATKQWFIALDKNIDITDKSLRELALNGVEKTKFYPATGKNRLKSMVENRPDWCISRQRTWGVPIAFFRDKRTKEVILDDKVLNFIALIFEREGCDAWYSRDIKELLYPGSGYNPNDLEKVNDILDVWFDSGSTWSAVLESRDYDAGDFPANIYLEGSDQHRGWFQSSLLVSSAIKENPPYKSILTHGFTVDKNGEKMSKSKGNVVSPQEVTKKYGSEILRLWVALSDYQNDLKISDSILKQTAEQYRKIRNTFRFLLANVNDLEEISNIEELGELDRWILSKYGEVLREVERYFNNYNFVKGLFILNNFITNELSGIYMDICKDRLYCDIKSGKERRASQSSMALIAKSMLVVLAPILTYTIDEVLEYAPKIVKGDAEDVFDLVKKEFINVESPFNDTNLLKARENFSEEVDRLKKAKKIKSTLELEIVGNRDILGLKEQKNLEDWFVVSNFKTVGDSGREEIGKFQVADETFKIYKSSLNRCPRCWRETVVEKESLCERCEEVINV